jgi:hypothetical protein
MVVHLLDGGPRGNNVGLTKCGDRLTLSDAKGQAAMEPRLDGIEKMGARFLDGPRVPRAVRGERVRQILQVRLELFGRHQQPSTIASTVRTKVRHSACRWASARSPFRVI